jgi:hypothetical protein
MSYNDMKLNIEGLLSLEPACVAAHEGAMLWATFLAIRVEGGVGVSPASCMPSTLCEEEAGRRGGEG